MSNSHLHVAAGYNSPLFYLADVTIGFGQDSYSVMEGSGPVLLTISVLEGTLATPVNVTLTTASDTAQGTRN